MKDLSTLIGEYAVLLTREMKNILDKSDVSRFGYEKVCDSVDYSVSAGGKRIRPFLVLEFYKAVSGKSDITAALPYAAAMEFMHTSSLIHDDLPAMDNDDMRRGKPSNHKVFGEATAILAGDALMLLSAETIASNPHCSYEQNAKGVIELMKHAGIHGMIGGQQIDLLGEAADLDLDTIKKMHRLKTGELIATSCVLGCIAANASEEQIEAAREYGMSLGLAFQIVDDIIDVEGVSYKAGKTLGKDAKYKKSTYVSVCGLERSKEDAKALSEKAKNSLLAFPDGNASKELEELCDFLLFRNN
ncbi:MAG: polyprenyl synthetase family protein [Ruminococcaceae bacterium]|nr:polyprenyl synthetase family protein [Oscillospiraceae bacterium]